MTKNRLFIFVFLLVTIAVEGCYLGALALSESFRNMGNPKDQRFPARREGRLNGLKGELVGFIDSASTFLPVTKPDSKLKYYIEFHQLRRGFGITYLYSYVTDTSWQPYQNYIHRKTGFYSGYLCLWNYNKYYVRSDKEGGFGSTFARDFMYHQFFPQYSALTAVLDGQGKYEFKGDKLLIQISNTGYDYKPCNVTMVIRDVTFNNEFVPGGHCDSDRVISSKCDTCKVSFFKEFRKFLEHQYK